MVVLWLTSKYDVSFWVYEFGLCSHYNVTQNSKTLNCIRNWRIHRGNAKRMKHTAAEITERNSKKEQQKGEPTFYEQSKNKTKIEYKCATGTHSFRWAKCRLILFPLSCFKFTADRIFFGTIFSQLMEIHYPQFYVFIFNLISYSKWMLLNILWLIIKKNYLLFHIRGIQKIASVVS